MEFNKPYNRTEFVTFLRTKFLPEDFVQEEETIMLNSTNFATSAIKLGACNSLELVVYEIKHNSHNDARVGLSRDAFRMLANEYESRALVIFVPEDSNDNYRFSYIELTLEQSDDSSRVSRTYSNPRRLSYYLGKDIAYYTPNKYLNEAGRVVNADDLKSRFSVDVLTKEFYQELSDWYAWAIKVVEFPNDIEDPNDNEKYNHESTIRLITRLIFVWFLKQRGLIPWQFFDEKYIADNLLKGFTPHAQADLFGKSRDSHYYKAILQNLFFAMLNSPMTVNGSSKLTERHFRREGAVDFDNNKLMRYENLFINPAHFVDLANSTVPFLNGGLFDCLDDKSNKMYLDAFTDNEKISRQLVIPDYLFFGEEVGKNIDLSEWYGDAKKKKVSARGIIDILKRYNFTVEENTPFDQDVSLDPELLGKVFENLLAAFNPETQTTARKQTGSFYTPREIVQYMVDESLIAHLCRTIDKKFEPEFRKLVQYTDDTLEFTLDQRKAIMQSLYNCKILDPACGSGAFPVGMLQQMVHILNRIDPDNELWKEMMLQNAISETSDAYRTASDDERAEIVADIERSFDENVNRPDYARKLYLIENCIYGVDIQPIAIQISKLRFFISLVVDQKINNNPADNFGIRPLPNLEAKFVAANSLLSLKKKENSLFDLDAIKSKEAELKIAKHKIFSAKTVKTKRKWKSEVFRLRNEIANLLLDSDVIGNETAKDLASWDMFDQNTSSPFFDAEWMFGVASGFDIVIANPPYVSTKGVSAAEKKIYENELGFSDDLYNMFTFKGISLCVNGGSVTYITPKTFWTTQTKRNMRDLMLKNELRYVFDTANPFEAVMVDTCIWQVVKTPYSADRDNVVQFLDGSKDLQNPLIFDGIKQSVYLNTQNSVIFKPTTLNLRIWNLYGRKVKELYDKWWDKIKTSRDIEKNKVALKAYRDSLKPGDIALLGCLTEGGQGLATANNGKYIAVRRSTKWASNIIESRPKKLREAIAKFKISIQELNRYSSVDEFLADKSESEIANLFDSLKNRYGRDIFGQGYIYKIIDDSDIANVDELTKDERENGIDTSKKYYVPYDKGDKDGNRWYLETPFAIAWSKENVQFLKTDPKARYQGYTFYFREGFCWIDVNSTYLKSRLKGRGVFDVLSMSLYTMTQIPDWYFVCIINSELISLYVDNFINNTSHFQINDARQLPIIIPTDNELKAYKTLIDSAIKLKKDTCSSRELIESQLAVIQESIDESIERLFKI
jgi:predicted GNAT family acetyltransferase